MSDAIRNAKEYIQILLIYNKLLDHHESLDDDDLEYLQYVGDLVYGYEQKNITRTKS